MHSAVKISLLSMILLAWCVSSAMGIEIGDPKEIFLKPVPDKYKAEYIHDRETPKNFDEFSKYFKKDFGIFKKNISTLVKDVKDSIQHVYQDPDFIPPQRPDWR